MRGRKPKPSTLHRLEGTRAHQPREHEPQASGPIGEPPGHLDASAANLWRYYVANSPPGLLTSLDRAVFTTFIQAATAIDECAATLNREGLLVETPRGLIEHPAARSMARLSAVLLRAAAECGFSPASRPRIQVQPQDAPNPFTAFRAAASKPH